MMVEEAEPSHIRPPTRRPLAPASGRHWDGVFAGLEGARGLILAVSGGPDSMALMLLASRWADSLDAPPALHVATIDHGLRPEAVSETALVEEAASALGLSCAILHWAGPKPATRIQERARAARYALLADHARTVGADVILTAHHADDQAETLLLRLARGSGLTGLVGMRRESALASDLALVRPLLAIPKSDLVTLCRHEGQSFVEDTSNRDPAYARARLRADAAALDRLGLDRVALSRLARRMARADAALEAETDRLERGVGPVRTPGRYAIVLAAARGAEPEILLRLIRRAIAHVAGPGRVIRLERLEALSEAINAALRAGRPYRATLAGTRIILGRDTLLDVCPEPPRRRGLHLPQSGRPICRD